MSESSNDNRPGTLGTYMHLVRVLDEHKARYRLIDHAPEGRTEIVSQLRGHDVKNAAKCIVLMVKLGRKQTKHVLSVVPGDRRVDLAAVKRLFGASYVSLASTEVAERLAGCVAGTVLPFAFNTELELIADPSLMGAGELFFNAARLDRSIALNAEDYFRVAKPRMENIAEPAKQEP